jgi:hypothetical protein
MGKKLESRNGHDRLESAMAEQIHDVLVTNPAFSRRRPNAV